MTLTPGEQLLAFWRVWFAAEARKQVDAREGIDGAVDGIDICGHRSDRAGSRWVCANPPGHFLEHVGHRYVHDTREVHSEDPGDYSMCLCGRAMADCGGAP